MGIGLNTNPLKTNTMNDYTFHITRQELKSMTTTDDLNTFQKLICKLFKISYTRWRQYTYYIAIDKPTLVCIHDLIMDELHNNWHIVDKSDKKGYDFIIESMSSLIIFNIPTTLALIYNSFQETADKLDNK